MQQKEFDKSKIFRFHESIDYTEGGIVSKNVLKRETGNISLFSFDKEEQLSTHAAPFDALVQVVEGEGKIILDGIEYDLIEGDAIIMPANVPHSVYATEPFKMVLTMIKE